MRSEQEVVEVYELLEYFVSASKALDTPMILVRDHVAIYAFARWVLGIEDEKFRPLLDRLREFRAVAEKSKKARTN